MPRSGKLQTPSRSEITACAITRSGVCEVSPSTANAIAESVSAYGDRLAPLHRSTWGYAIYRWMGDYWQMLVDLTTEGEEVSDLTLHAKLHDTEPPTLEIESVHVA